MSISLHPHQELSLQQAQLALIPNAVYEAAQRAMRSELLERYGDDRKLIEAPRLGYVQVLTCYVKGESSAVARRMLDRCASHYGSFIEMPRTRKGAVRVWRLAPWFYEHLRAEALEHWQKVGYVVGQRVPEIKEGNQVP